MEIFGIPVWQLVLSLAVIAVAVVARGVVADLLLRRIRTSNSRARVKVDDSIIASLERPLRFLPLAVAFVVIATFLDGAGWLTHAIWQISMSLTVIFLFWLLFEAVGAAFLLISRRNESGTVLIGWIVKWCRIVLVLLAVLTILQIWGVRVWPFLAGAGVFGFALALGAKDLFRDLIAGIFVISEVRYQNNDWIEVDDVVNGTVEAIGLRTTRVRLFDTAIRHVPNSQLGDDALTNYSKMKHLQLDMLVKLDCRTTVAQLREVRSAIEDHIRGNDDFVQPPDGAIRVHVAELGESSIDLSVYCFTVTTDLQTFLTIREGLIFHIMESVEAAGTRLAVPTEAVILDRSAAGRRQPGGDDRIRPATT